MTRQTPATVREILSEINLRLPIIAMDGAVLYDLQTMKYVRKVKIKPDLVREITDFLHSEGMPFFVNTIQDNLLVIYFKDYKDLILEEVKDAYHDGVQHEHLSKHELSKSAYISMSRIYNKKRISPYRNYVRTNSEITRDVIYILTIDRSEKIDRLHEKLMAQPWADKCRTNFDTFDCEEGEKILRIYAAGANREDMLKYLQRYVGAPRILTFGNDPGECDVLIEDAAHDRMVKELKKRFEPVSLKGWRNIIHM